MFLRRFLFLVYCNYPKACLKLEVNKPQTYIHICELTRIERKSPAFQETYSQRKCCSISPAFVRSNPPWKYWVWNIKLSLKPWHIILTLSWRRSLSCRNQSKSMQSKSMDWFLYDKELCHERVNLKLWHITYVQLTTWQLMFSIKSNLICWPKIFFLKIPLSLHRPIKNNH